MTTRKNNIIFMEGKEKALQKFFSSSNFGYLAVGYNSSNDTNGFINPSSEEDSTDNGFNEISGESSTYTRVPLHFESIIDKDYDNGKITAKLTAELGLDNIVETIPINQIAIVDTDEVGSGSTTFFAAAVTEEFQKNEQLALVFVIEVTM